MKSLRILVLGAEGLLGTTVSAVIGGDPQVGTLVAAGRGDVDVTCPGQVHRIIDEVRPDAVINTAALMPADRCDEQPDEAYAVNALGARWVSRECARIGAVAVYISTDFVFEGQAGVAYDPGASPHPMLTYGVTKLAGEHETRLGGSRYLVTRTSCLFGPPPLDPNTRPCFVDRILERAATGADLWVVDNIVMSPTYTRDLAAMLLALLHNRAASGIYHLTNVGSASWHELASEALAGTGTPGSVAAIQEQSFTSSPRPLHTPLTGTLPDFVQRVNRPWRAALADYLATRRLTPAVAGVAEVDR